MKDLEQAAARGARRIVGLMSGTSGDGIDAALVEVEGCGRDTRLRLLVFERFAFETRLRRRLFALFAPGASVDELCRLNFALGEALARAALGAIAAAGLEPRQVDLIASHGQTVRHLPGGSPPSTLQIGEPAVIAQRTGIATIADFRPADVALGGQGAPLVPLADYLLFADAHRGRLLLNIGGMANITVLPAGGGLEAVRAFDLGPGNALIDAAVAQSTRGRERFDRGGGRAAAGRVDEAVLGRLLAHEFLQRPPPKSTGREEFGARFLAALRRETKLGGNDLIATLTAFTARAIAAGLERFVLPLPGGGELWVGGGGAHNAHLMRLLQEALPRLQVGPLEGLGTPAGAREAICFAVLANETLMGHCGNLPAVTGARRAAVLGKIVPGHNKELNS